MISRRQTREFLLQSLYARTQLTTFDRDIFVDAYFSGDNSIELDTAYLDVIEPVILSHEADLMGIVSILAPRFELQTIPVIHILILMIALSELLYAPSLEIPPSVVANEAVELAKKFSDAQGKNFINGALSTFLKDQQAPNLSSQPSSIRIFL